MSIKHRGPLALSLICLAAACDGASDVGAPAAPAKAAAALAADRAADRFSEWSPPVNLGPTVNSPFVDNLPELSRDRLTLYFTSGRPGGSGALDLWVSRRASVRAPWGPPANLGPRINSSANDAAPNLSPDGHYLFITSNRPGSLGMNDIWVSYRADVHDDFAWGTPVNLGPPISSPAFDAGAAYGRSEFYFTRGPTGAALDIYVSSVSRHDGDGDDDRDSECRARAGRRQKAEAACSHGFGFGAPRLVAELSSAANDQRPTLPQDMREIFFSSNRPGGLGADDIWGATRRRAAGSWSPPVNLGPAINTPFVESQPGVSRDGTTLFFSSDRPGGSGGLDLYMSTRRVRSWD